MRQKRAKIYRKLMHQFQLHFGFREPYQLLIDESFAQSLTRLKTQNPPQQFVNVLGGKVKPMITQCCMVALYQLGKEQQGTIDLAKSFERRKCNHREAIDAGQCIKEVIGSNNKHRYILASDVQSRRSELRNSVPGLPMIHFTQAVMVLEPMSDLSRDKVDQLENAKLSLPAAEAELLSSAPASAVPTNIIGGETEGTDETDEPPSKRRKGPKAPNPLSVKKSKKEKLSMEEKLEREAELKKLKQKQKAAERLQAQKAAAAGQDAESTRRRKRDE